jgi:hypothetical protein
MSASHLFGHDLVRKPVPTFRDHGRSHLFDARGANSRNRSISVSEERRPIMARSIE